ncbi:MAG: hypothetical protein K1563_10695, partial [Candidatus Thiodiazotropha sp. (ex. Lucinisca nassula)]|nr:hypothetical protein [Candidatus Thiodiazotropha sp. (ex. Lucinisca nassula)]
MIQSRFYLWLLPMLLLCVGAAGAATQVLDRIELTTEGKDDVVNVYFNIPVRYVSHLINESGNEVGVQLKLGQTADIELTDLVESDQLTWSPSAAVPLEKVEF